MQLLLKYPDNVRDTALSLLFEMFSIERDSVLALDKTEILYSSNILGLYNKIVSLVDTLRAIVANLRENKKEILSVLKSILADCNSAGL